MFLTANVTSKGQELRRGLFDAVRVSCEGQAADVSLLSSHQGSFYVPSENCLQRAQMWHQRLCRLLLAAHRGLRLYYVGLMKEVPQLTQVEIGNSDYNFLVLKMYLYSFTGKNTHSFTYIL